MRFLIIKFFLIIFALPVLSISDLIENNQSEALFKGEHKQEIAAFLADDKNSAKSLGQLWGMMARKTIEEGDMSLIKEAYSPKNKVNDAWFLPFKISHYIAEYVQNELRTSWSKLDVFIFFAYYKERLKNPDVFLFTEDKYKEAQHALLTEIIKQPELLKKTTAALRSFAPTEIIGDKNLKDSAGFLTFQANKPTTTKETGLDIIRLYLGDGNYNYPSLFSEMADLKTEEETPYLRAIFSSTLHFIDHLLENNTSRLIELFINMANLNLHEIESINNEDSLKLFNQLIKANKAILASSNSNLIDAWQVIYYKYIGKYLTLKHVENENKTSFDIHNDTALLNDLLLYLFERTFKKFKPSMIFSDLPQGELKLSAPLLLEPAEPAYVIANNAGYIGNDVNVGNIITGLPLKMDPADLGSLPIGYNIHLPANDKVQAALIEVYGGFTKKELEERAYRPNALDSFHKKLLGQGMAIITLNLPDLLLLEVFQGKMPKDVAEKIHQAIDRFFYVLKYDPRKLFDGAIIDRLKGLPLFLYGASFGGRTSIRHAELYPNTFSGYLSHDGSASFEARAMCAKASCSARSIDDSFKPLTYLDPMSEIKKIEQPILLLHNYDDNNVNIKITIDFYNQAKALGKSVQVFFTDQGNPITFKKEKADLVNRGHFLPVLPSSLDLYTHVVLGFMRGGPSALPAVSNWRAYLYSLYADKHFITSVQDGFISLSLRVYQQALLNPNSDQGPLQIMASDSSKRDEAFDKYYRHIYLALAHVADVQNSPTAVKSIIDKGLSEEAITNALEIFLVDFLQFTAESNSIRIPKDFDKTILKKSLQGKFIELLNQYTYAPALLRALYIGNPALLEGKEVVFKDELDKAKNDLIHKIQTIKKLKGEAWRDIIKHPGFKSLLEEIKQK